MPIVTSLCAGSGDLSAQSGCANRVPPVTCPVCDRSSAACNRSSRATGGRPLDAIGSADRRRPVRRPELERHRRPVRWIATASASQPSIDRRSCAGARSACPSGDQVAPMHQAGLVVSQCWSSRRRPSRRSRACDPSALMPRFGSSPAALGTRSACRPATSGAASSGQLRVMLRPVSSRAVRVDRSRMSSRPSTERDLPVLAREGGAARARPTASRRGRRSAMSGAPSPSSWADSTP